MDFPFLAFKLAAYVDTTITLYIDSEISNNFMFQFANDLQSLRIGDVQTTSSQDWSKYEYIVLANINVYPESSDEDYAKLVRNLFRKHLTDLKLNKDAVLFLGQNFRGLIAAKEICQVHENLKGNVFVYSSIFRASLKAFGDGGRRYLPDVGGDLYATDEIATCEEIECLKGTWPFGSFCLLEAETLYDGISSHIENSGGFNELEVVGKFPTTTESDRYGADKNFPVFMSVQTTPYQALRYEQYLRETNEYFAKSYKKC